MFKKATCWIFGSLRKCTHLDTHLLRLLDMDNLILFYNPDYGEPYFSMQMPVVTVGSITWSPVGALWEVCVRACICVYGHERLKNSARISLCGLLSQWPVLWTSAISTGRDIGFLWITWKYPLDYSWITLTALGWQWPLRYCPKTSRDNL